jgi:hypothetical protein
MKRWTAAFLVLLCTPLLAQQPAPPAAEDGRFRQVTDVTWDPAGNIYIGDGYINSRVAKADKNGNWLKSWGDRGDKPGEFNTPHNIAADAKGNIYVAELLNWRVQKLILHP